MHGMPFHDAEHAVESLDEALTVIRRLWREDEPFDFHGKYVDLTGRVQNLLDEAYAEVRGFPALGITGIVGVRVAFE